MSLSWNSLFANGSVIDLNLSIWGARTRITAADLGIRDSEEVQKALSLGCHRLAPAEAFEAIHVHARAAKRVIEHYSLNFALIKGARYVPDTNLEMVLNALRGHQIDFAQSVEDFLSNYETMKLEMLPIIRQALQHAAKTPDSAANAYSRVLSEYPSSEAVRQKFNLSWSVYAVQGAKSKAALAAINTETDNVKSIVRSMVEQLRGEITEKLGKVLAAVTKGGKLTNKSYESAIAVLDRVDSLNVLEDQTLADQINAVRTMLNSVDPKKDVDQNFITGLTQIQSQLETSLEQAVKDAESALTGVGKRKLGV